MNKLNGRVFVSALSFSRYSPEPRRLLEEHGLELFFNDKGRPLNEEEMRQAVNLYQPEALIVGVDPVTAPVMEAAVGLKIIAKHGVGVDNIDVAAARERGIVVSNAPGSNAQAVADLAFGLLLACARDLVTADRTTRQGRWDRIAGCELWEKVIGIVGTGQIGLAVAQRAKGFAMRILAYDPCPNAEAAASLGIVYTDLDSLLRESDFVSLHAPLTEATYHLLDERRLKLMKKEAILINTARGELVDEDALYRALKEGWIKGAGLDVFSAEPPVGSPLLELSNVVVTPHIGAYTREANWRMGMAAAKSILKALQGEKVEFEVG